MLFLIYGYLYVNERTNEMNEYIKFGLVRVFYYKNEFNRHNNVETIKSKNNVL